MKNEIALQSEGSRWEEHIFGTSAGDVLQTIPQHKSRHLSLQEIMLTPMVRFGDNGERYVYEPTKPNWGKSGDLWCEVRRNLPIQEEIAPLSLYVACQTPRTALDYWHGIDAFFFWDGAYVTLDASLTSKAERKADFVITPRDMMPTHLIHLGIEIAHLLKKKRRSTIKKTKKKSR